jgi:hypothetical protein
MPGLFTLLPFTTGARRKDRNKPKATPSLDIMPAAAVGDRTDSQEKSRHRNHYNNRYPARKIRH